LERCAWPYNAKALIPFSNRGLCYFNSSRKKEEQIAALRPFIYEGEVPFEPGVWNRIMDRVEIWSDPGNPLEWACGLIVKPRVDKNEAIVPVTDFVEMPVWALSRSHGLSFLIDDFLRVAAKMFIIGELHSHPDGNLLPSSSDWATFTYLDAMLGRPLLHLIVGPDRKRKPLIIHFETCYKCPNSFLKILEKIKENGGE
jgi:proteasome lid subunit RPN8/RPN11